MPDPKRCVAATPLPAGPEPRRTSATVRPSPVDDGTRSTARRKAATLLAAIAAAMSLPSSAQTTNEDILEYCYGTACGPTKESAIAALEAEFPDYAGLFEEVDKEVKWIAPNKERPLWFTFRVKERKPESYLPAVYGGDWGNPAPTHCAASGDPVYPNYCASEGAFVQGYVNWYVQIYGANRVQHSVNMKGGYVMPFAEITNGGTPERPLGQLQHNNWRNGTQMPDVTVTVYNENGTVASGHGGIARITKFTTFECRKGFYAKTGAHPAYNPTATYLVEEATCLPMVGDKTVTTRLRQTTCPPIENANAAEGNPCYPATGDKAQFETDFEFAGRPFGRVYHSLGQAEQRTTLAPRWVHSYSDRISGNPTGNEPLVLTDDQGQLDVFIRQGSSNRFLSESGINRVIDRQPDGMLILTDRGGLIRRFDASGQLTRIERSGSAWHIELIYEEGRLATATDHTGRELTFAYTGKRLSSITLPEGQSVSYAYDAEGNLQTVQFPGGRTRSYHYNETGLSDAGDRHALTGVSNNGERFATFAYDARNRARLTHHHANGAVVDRIALVYGMNGTVNVTGRNGESRGYVIGVQGGYRRAVSIAHIDGTFTNTFNGATPVQQVDKLGIVTRYEFTDGYESARYEAFGTPLERKTSTLRDDAYRVTSRTISIKSGAGYVAKLRTDFVYNTRGQLSASCEFDPTDSVAAAYVCDSTAQAPLGVRKISTTYCEDADVASNGCPMTGLVKVIDGPRTDVTDVTAYSYYSSDATGCSDAASSCAYHKGDLQRITNARGHALEYLSYDGAGRPLVQLDANGVVSTFEYDAAGRLTTHKIRGTDEASELDDRIIRFEYWPSGMVRKLIRPDGTYTTFSYDTAQRLTGVTDNAGNSIDYVLNAAGQRIQEDVRDSAGNLRKTLSSDYDLLSRLRAETDAYGRATTITRDARGRIDTTTDALNRVEDQDFDSLDRLVHSLRDRDGIASESTFEYDALDRPARVVDPSGLATTYSYDTFGNLLSLNSPDSGTTTSTYDQAGNRTGRVDANGKVVSYRYDVLNRLKVVDYTAAVPDEVLTYDLAMSDCPAGENFNVGRLGKVMDESGNTTYCYNRFGDLVRKVQRTGNRTLILRSQYGADGRLRKVIRPGNVEVDYQHDTAGRISEIGVNFGAGRIAVLSGATYHPFGAPAQWTYGNGRTMTRDVDLNYRPRRIKSGSAGTLDYGYTFDDVGNLTELKNGITDAPIRHYGYDGLDRIVTERVAGFSSPLREYSYDKTGDRTGTIEQMVVDGGPGPGGGNTYQPFSATYAYLTGSHRLINDGIDVRQYDAAGNLIRIGSDNAPGGPRKIFTYNEGNRLSSVARNTTLATYAYNTAGERVRRIAYGVETISLYDAAGQWIGDYNAYGAAEQQVIWLGNLPVGVVVGNGATAKLYYVEPDGLGTPRSVVDPQRDVVVWRWNSESEVFGKDYPNEDADGDGVAFTFDMRFPGQRFDAPSGLNYNYFRDYDAQIGRYVEPDPIGLAGGMSLYGYVAGNPARATDPLGLEIVGIHSSAFSHDPSPASGHGWLGIYSDDGRLLETWGAWQGGHERTKDAPNGCKCEDSNVYRDIEKNNPQAYTPRQSLYLYVSPQELAALRQFISQKWEFGQYRTNCASWVDDAVEHVWPYLKLNVTDIRALGATTPRALSDNLRYLHDQVPNNSLSNPLNQPPGWKPRR